MRVTTQFCLFVIALAMPFLAVARTLVGWDFAGSGSAATERGYAYATNGLTVSTFKLCGASGNSKENSFGGKAFTCASLEDAIDNQNKHYFEFSVTVANNHEAEIDAISQFDIYRSGTGPSALVIQCSLDGNTYMNIHEETFTVDKVSHVGSVSLPSDRFSSLQGGDTVYFRFVLYNGKNTGTFYFYNGNTVDGSYDIALLGTCERTSIGELHSLDFTTQGCVVSTNGNDISSYSPIDLPPDTDVVFTALPGYELVSVTTNGFAVEGIDVGASSYAFTMPEENMSISVVFAEWSIDDIPAIPVCNGVTVSENFDSLGPAAAQTHSKLPDYWRVTSDAESGKTYALSYFDGTDETTRSVGAGNSISDGAIYNFTTGNREMAGNHAVGFMSSDSACRSCLLAVPLRNTGAEAITSIRVGYSVQKFRDNKRAKKISMRISRDGETWLPCDDGFVTEFESDAAASNVYTNFPAPIRVKSWLNCNIAPGKTLFVGWFFNNVVNTVGGNESQAIAVDDIRIRVGRPLVLVVD